MTTGVTYWVKYMCKHHTGEAAKRQVRAITRIEYEAKWSERKCVRIVWDGRRTRRCGFEIAGPKDRKHFCHFQHQFYTERFRNPFRMKTGSKTRRIHAST